MRRSRLAILVLSICLAAPCEAPAQAAPRAGAEAAGLLVRFDNRDIREVVNSIGLATGTRFVYGDELRGRISITVPGKVAPGEALELLNSALYMRGFAAIPIAGGSVKIVPIVESLSASELVGENEALDEDSDRSVLTLLRLDHANAADVADTLGGYVPQAGAVVAYEPSNSLVVAGTEAQLHRLLYIAQALDRAAAENVMAKILRHRSAEVVVEWVDSVFNQSENEASHIDLWTDERANMIVARASPERIAELRNFLDDFDRPPEGEGDLHVVPIRNRDAEQIVTIIESFQRGTPEVQSVVTGPEAVETVDIGEELTGRDFDVTVDAPTRSLVVRADAETFGLISDLVDELDKIPPRISIEVAVMEISRPAAFTLGFDFFLPLTQPSGPNDVVGFVKSTPSLGNTLSGVPSEGGQTSQLFARYARDPVQITLTDPSGLTVATALPREDVAIQAGERNVETSLLIRPQLVVLSGEEHEIFVGNNVPVPTAAGSPTEAQSQDFIAAPGFLPQNTIRQNIERVDIGVTLRVKPIVGEQGMVILEMTLEISDTVESVAGDVDRVGPTFLSQSIEATLRLNSERHAVIGTFTGQTMIKGRSGTPFLMDIPFIGHFFRRVDNTLMDNSVVAVVSARVLRSHEEDAAESIRQRLAFERSISRTFELQKLSQAPYAVLLETTTSELLARRIALGFEEDGFGTRVIGWEMDGQRRWDVYLTGVASFEEAGELANRLIEADWDPRITVLAAENEFAIE